MAENGEPFDLKNYARIKRSEVAEVQDSDQEICNTIMKPLRNMQLHSPTKQLFLSTPSFPQDQG